MTTLSRLAKVIKGYTPPIGWIERAFASLVTAIHSVLPEYSISDVDKVLTIDKDEGHEVTKHIVNEQSVTTNASGRADLAANSYNLTGLEDNEEVTVLLNGVATTFYYLNGGLWGPNDEQITYIGKLHGFSHSATFTISCSKTVTEYEPMLDWKAVRQTPAVGTNDKGKYLHTNDSTGDLEWDAVRQTPAVGENDKDKYLHTNASTGALEWAEAGGGGNTGIVIATDNGQGVLDKTYNEIRAASFSIINTASQGITQTAFVSICGESNDAYIVVALGAALSGSSVAYQIAYSATTPDGVLTLVV